MTADETRENATEDSPTPAESCLHLDAKTNKRCDHARVAGRMYCEAHKSEGGGGGGGHMHRVCYDKIRRDY
jgi:hypothetical protein